MPTVVAFEAKRKAIAEHIGNHGARGIQIGAIPVELCGGNIDAVRRVLLRRFVHIIQHAAGRCGAKEQTRGPLEHFNALKRRVVGNGRVHAVKRHAVFKPAVKLSIIGKAADKDALEALHMSGSGDHAGVLFDNAPGVP